MAYIYSKNAVRESILNKKNIKCVYVNSNKHELYNLAINNHVEVKVLNGDQFNKFLLENKLASEKVQGIVALVNDYKYYELQEIIQPNTNKYPFVVMLDSLEDPHNLGAILRTCDAAGVDGVIIGKNRCVRLNDTVAKVSTGAIEYVKVVEVTNLNDTIKKLKDCGYWIVGAEYTEKSVMYNEMKYDMPVCLVVGSEGKGISQLVTKNCDFLVKIPMNGHVNSLNASVSASILIYEITKFRGRN